jgi:hypothetical protein
VKNKRNNTEPGYWSCSAFAWADGGGETGAIQQQLAEHQQK